MIAEALPVPPKPPSDPAQVAQRRRHPAPRPAHADRARRRGGARRGAGERPSHRRRDRRAADRAGRQRADLARPGPGAGGPHPLCRRYRGEGAGRHAARHPVRAAQAGDVLRLSRTSRPRRSRRTPTSTCWRGRTRTPPRRWPGWPTTLSAPKVADPRPWPAAGAGARQADAGVGRRHARRAAAGAGGGHRRGGHLRPRVLPVHLCRRAARLAELHRRRDRLRPAAGHRRGGRRARPARDRPAGRRLGDVHAAGAVDPGAREPGRHHGPAVQPQVSDPAGRTGQRRGQSRPHRARHAGPRQPRPGLDQARRRHGRGGARARRPASGSPTCSPRPMRAKARS